MKAIKRSVDCVFRSVTKWAAVPLVLALLVGLLTSWATPAHANFWVVQIVDHAEYAGLYNSLALDTNGHPHISYHGSSTEGLKYAYHDGDTWNLERVDEQLWPFVGQHTSLALDGDDYPHISYFDGLQHILKYAHMDASGWYSETVDASGWAGSYTSLALNGDDYPHISYSAWLLGDLKYAYQDTTGWHVETVDSDGQVGAHTSLALDGAGYPHISYYDADNQALKYAHMDATTTGWLTATVDVGLGEYWQGYTHYISMALDDAGYPHIGYMDVAAGDLKHAYMDASGWHTPTVDSELSSDGGGISLALDGDAYAHFSYYVGGPDFDIKYAFQDAAGWHLGWVRQGYAYTSLALDGDGLPHISYYDGSYFDLRYARYVVADHIFYLPSILH